MAESSKTHHFIPVIIFPSKVLYFKLYFKLYFMLYFKCQSLKQLTVSLLFLHANQDVNLRGHGACKFGLRILRRVIQHYSIID